MRSLPLCCGNWTNRTNSDNGSAESVTKVVAGVTEVSGCVIPLTLGLQEGSKTRPKWWSSVNSSQNYDRQDALSGKTITSIGPCSFSHYHSHSRCLASSHQLKIVNLWVFQLVVLEKVYTGENSEQPRHEPTTDKLPPGPPTVWGSERKHWRWNKHASTIPCPASGPDSKQQQPAPSTPSKRNKPSLLKIQCLRAQHRPI